MQVFPTIDSHLLTPAQAASAYVARVKSGMAAERIMAGHARAGIVTGYVAEYGDVASGSERAAYRAIRGWNVGSAPRPTRGNGPVIRRQASPLQHVAMLLGAPLPAKRPQLALTAG